MKPHLAERCPCLIYPDKIVRCEAHRRQIERESREVGDIRRGLKPHDPETCPHPRCRVPF